ncbi:MAG: heme o synthase [Thermoplasmata archaeon]|nr:heme o synthase [Thermoplasmata archaeon]
MGDGGASPGTTAPPPSVGSRLSDYLELTKPTITGLIVAVGIAGYFIAAPGPVNLRLLLGLVVFGAAASGGAAALNHYLDRDLDAQMKRTQDRPLPGLRIHPERGALLLGVGLTVFGIGGAALTLNLLTAFSIALGTFTYVVVYTAWLKRRTSWNIVVGGFAGSAPALAGSAAATGTWTDGALALALLVFLWTPPHFWSLALMLQKDYDGAGLPMLPRAGDAAGSARVAVISAALLLPATIVLLWVRPDLALWAAVALVALVLLFIALEAPLWRAPERKWAVRGFIFSGIYLLLVILVLVLNGLLMHPGVVVGF